MWLKKWDNIPEELKNDEVRKYYDIIKEKQISIFVKRLFDIIASFILIILLSPILAVISIMIKIDSKGPVFFRQERITQYGRTFKIFKFRTMVNNAEKIGSQVTVQNDSRVTRVGKLLRKVRLDELPQVLNILIGDMSFVGTRPEVKKYVDLYTDEMKATLLMKAGVTSLASIKFKDEEKLLQDCNNVDKVYMNEVLPQKMKYNLEYLENFSLFYDVNINFMTILAVLH